MGSSESRATRSAGAPIPSPADMETMGAALGEALKEPGESRFRLTHLGRAAVVYLQGPLGAGKTTLARGVLRAMGVRGAVKSPTYTLVEPYVTDHGQVAHFDLYRIGDLEEVEYLGMREFLDEGVCLFEWPERAPRALPPPDLCVEIAFADTARALSMRAGSAYGETLLDWLILRDLLQESA